MIVMILAATFVHLAQADLDDGLAAYQREDYVTALREFQSAAGQGNAVAQYHLGMMYDFGKGVPQDDHEAFAWYRLAAEQGILPLARG